MKCCEINELLDRFMDDQLTEDEIRQLHAHGEDCSECAEIIRATFDMKDMFAQMEEEVDVPLVAQAAWRKAVKAEVSRRKFKMIYRAVGAVAAVAVLAVGVGVGVNMKDAAPNLQNEHAVLLTAGAKNDTMVSAAGGAVIQADGEEDVSSAKANARTVSADNNPMHEWIMKVDDLQTACSHIEDLVAEYEGTAEVQRFEEENAAGMNLYISLPAENIGDFMNAANHLNISEQSLEPFENRSEGTCSLLIVLNTK